MRVLIAILFSAIYVLVGSPVNKQVSHATSVTVTTAVAKPSAPQESVKPQPEKETVITENPGVSEKTSIPGTPQAVAPQETVKPPEPAPQPQGGGQTDPPLTNHEQLMQAADISPQDWNAVDYIVSHESGWRPTVLNSEGCVGLGQRCPASTLYAVCPDLDPVCQLRHFSIYAVSRYGGWWGAYSFWTSHRWW